MITEVDVARLLMTLEQAVPHMGLREALQRAFERGRIKGQMEGLECAIRIIDEKTK